MIDKQYNKERGILLHITSLPGEFGIGGLGKEARDFVDYLAKTNNQYWQILPLNYPGYGFSPYNAISSFAGNPYLIDPNGLKDMGLVTGNELRAAKIPNPGKTDFPTLIKTKDRLFQLAYKQFIATNGREILHAYIKTESYWLPAFMAFCLLREQYQAIPWQKWKPEHRFYTEQLYQELLHTYPEKLYYSAFLQYIFDQQLSAVKRYATDKGIKIIGDLPLYVSLESSDTWSHPEMFELDADGYPTQVAGVPPDAFSQTGQLWGNPLYRWELMKQDGFDWWKRRLTKAFVFADKLRLDHFIGYVNFWAIQASETTAINGNWCAGPKADFFDAMLSHFSQDRIIAEDLGILTDEINAMRDHYGFPGMIILQFCFEHEHNDILAFPADRIIYTGTHDNQTTAGWFIANLDTNPSANAILEAYLHKKAFLPETQPLTADNVSGMMIRLALASPCHIAIIPMQDVLALDDSARMNIPGIAEGNWIWRMTDMDTHTL